MVPTGFYLNSRCIHKVNNCEDDGFLDPNRIKKSNSGSQSDSGHLNYDIIYVHYLLFSHEHRRA